MAGKKEKTVFTENFFSYSVTSDSILIIEKSSENGTTVLQL